MDIITEFPANAGLLTLLLALAGLGFILLSISCMRHWRWLAASGNGLLGIVLLAVATTLLAIGLNLHTYHRLTLERPVAELIFEQVGPRHYHVRILYPDDQRYRDYLVAGDEWQLDARILKWGGLLILAGFDTQYRLERISGRYQDIEAERSQPRSAYQLTPNPGLDLWQLAREHERWLPWVDAYYGSATYLPMQDGARYEVLLTQTGLIARPLNRAGEQAVRGWR